MTIERTIENIREDISQLKRDPYTGFLLQGEADRRNELMDELRQKVEKMAVDGV